jgi:hypothetical protein
MSVHFKSAAGHMTALAAAAFIAFFGFASPEPCARTAAASRKDTTNARMFLPLITDLLVSSKMLPARYHSFPDNMGRLVKDEEGQVASEMMHR